MFDYVNIGSTPIEEKCFPCGHHLARQECAIFKHQLERQFPGADLRVKGFPHDFGTYYEVVAYYNPDDETGADLAFQVENDAPGEWDETARAELAA